METELFAIEYKLTLKDNSYMQTRSYVTAKNEETALVKLRIFREMQALEFKNLEYLKIDRLYSVIV